MSAGIAGMPGMGMPMNLTPELLEQMSKGQLSLGQLNPQQASQMVLSPGQMPPMGPIGVPQPGIAGLPQGMPQGMPQGLPQGMPGMPQGMTMMAPSA